LIDDLNLKIFFSKKVSFFRHYQNSFLIKHSNDFDCNIVEIGSEKQYNHSSFFTKSKSYLNTNIGGDCDKILDATNIDFADNSQEAYICLSVLEHIYEIDKAFKEIKRTLKPGGKLLLVIPFSYPIHDKVDYWRVSKDTYIRYFGDEFEIKDFCHLGETFSTMIENLSRPKTKWNLRYTIYKMLALVVLLFGKIFGRMDNFPIGYGLYAVKK